jgi:hypothetical protein
MTAKKAIVPEIKPVSNPDRESITISIIFFSSLPITSIIIKTCLFLSLRYQGSISRKSKDEEFINDINHAFPTFFVSLEKNKENLT